MENAPKSLNYLTRVATPLGNSIKIVTGFAERVDPQIALTLNLSGYAVDELVRFAVRNGLVD
jgi:hypothetical protein